MIGQFFCMAATTRSCMGFALANIILLWWWTVVSSCSLLRGRPVRAGDRRGGVGNLVHQTPADGLVHCLPGGKEPVDIRRTHAKFSGDIGHRRPMVTDATEVLLRRSQDPRAGLVGIFSRSDRSIHRSEEPYSAANAGRSCGFSRETSWISSEIGLIRNHAA